METIEVRYHPGPSSASGTVMLLRVIRSLKEKGVPINGVFAIQCVRHGNLSMYKDFATGEYVYTWTGEVQQADIRHESGLI